jgi:hypothetical protein
MGIYGMKYFFMMKYLCLLWSFLQSTTSKKEIAIQYTGIAKGPLFPTLLEIQPAAIDHGANISQYS